ncbi:MAG: hypothetical protein P1U77_07920 [Rubripirellula sp.]|nr:hypothetical protein [Rubripirellula sp.]
MMRQLPSGQGASRDTYRSIGAILGLSAGVLTMSALGFGGLVAGAIFAASGCVAGAIVGEQLHAKRRRDS